MYEFTLDIKAIKDRDVKKGFFRASGNIDQDHPVEGIFMPFRMNHALTIDQSSAFFYGTLAHFEKNFTHRLPHIDLKAYLTDESAGPYGILRMPLRQVGLNGTYSALTQTLDESKDRLEHLITGMPKYSHAILQASEYPASFRQEVKAAHHIYEAKWRRKA